MCNTKHNEAFHEISSLVRSDSGFAVHGLYELREKESVCYIIRLKSKAQPKALAEELHPTHEVVDVSMKESYVEDAIYQAASWSKTRRIIIQSRGQLANCSFHTHFS